MLDGMETHAKSGTATGHGPFAGRHIHLIGIGGSGMRALAQMLLQRGAIISGSDASPNGVGDRLRQQGATIHVGQRGENIAADCQSVVYSAAIAEQNPELLAARRRGLEILKYAEMLGRLMDEKIGLAVAGTHGKSTTTAMTAYTLNRAGRQPNFIVGATVPQLGGPSGVGTGEHFLAEACEYDRSFLNLHPQYATILNLEEDHLDCYRDLEAIIEAFRAFTAGMRPGGVLIANGEDRNVAEAVRDARCEVETFGLGEESHWRGVIVNPNRPKLHMEVLKGDTGFCELACPLPGLHNAYNTLAATAMLYHAGLSGEQIAEHLPTFEGTYRRMTFKGSAGGVSVVDDYAHHPTEIQATLRALRSYYQPRRLLCIFQPHQHSRTRFLLKDFAASFGLADEVIVPDIFFVRDSALEKDHVSSKDLVAQIRLRGGVAIYLKTFQIITEYLMGVLEEGDLVVTMGAGNIWEVADDIVRGLERNG